MDVQNTDAQEKRESIAGFCLKRNRMGGCIRHAVVLSTSAD